MNFHSIIKVKKLETRKNEIYNWHIGFSIDMSLQLKAHKDVHLYGNTKKERKINVITQHDTVQYSTVQYSTVQYSTVQYSTAQHNTAQHSRM